MEYLTGIISQIIENFDWAYMLSVNALTYFIIKVIDYANGEKAVSNILKKIILICCVIFLAIVYKLIGDIDNKILLNSAILAPVSWDFILRPIIKKIGIGYKTIKDTNEDDEASL